MTETSNFHIPVLLQEAVSYLITSPDGIYVDATFGRGSHARAILDQLSTKGRLIAFDKDPEAIRHANTHFADDDRFLIVHSTFAALYDVLEKMNVAGKVNGILFDLGVSSPQLDEANRGFSFSRDGELDMRMDTTQGIDAKTWLATVEEETLANVLWQYGEEKHSRRIARAILAAREVKPITRTAELAEIIKRAIPKPPVYQDKHPATRSFQAIRIVINQELTELTAALNQSLPVLTKGGRLAVISFHSLEDRIVKQFIRSHEKAPALPRGLPIKTTSFQSTLQTMTKPIKPTLQETQLNPRARSATLRIAEKKL